MTADLILTGLGCFCLGLVFGSWTGELSYKYYLRMKSEPKYRTAAFLGGKDRLFAYIIPEKEYVERMNRP